MAPRHVARQAFPNRRTYCGTTGRWSRFPIKGGEGDPREDHRGGLDMIKGSPWAPIVYDTSMNTAMSV